jgi:hypothetical protein
MINRRSVSALHRACLHQYHQPETENSGREFSCKPIENGHDSRSVQCVAGHSAGQGSDRTCPRFESVDPPLQFSDLNTDGAQDLRRPAGRFNALYCQLDGVVGFMKRTSS